MPKRRTFLLSALAAAAAAPRSALAQAEAWPARPIRFVVPFTAGGGSDVVARLLAEELTRILETNLVIENRAGQAGSIGADYVVKQPADGHTILICTPGIRPRQSRQAELFEHGRRLLEPSRRRATLIVNACATAGGARERRAQGRGQRASREAAHASDSHRPLPRVARAGRFSFDASTPWRPARRDGQ